MTSIEWFYDEIKHIIPNDFLPKYEEAKPTDHKDKIVQQVIDKFNQRSEVGIKKYGTTLEQNNNDDYFTHLQEELMDAILYIEKLKSLR